MLLALFCFLLDFDLPVLSLGSCVRTNNTTTLFICYGIVSLARLHILPAASPSGGHNRFYVFVVSPICFRCFSTVLFL